MASIKGARYRLGRAVTATQAYLASFRLDFDPGDNLYIFSDPRGGSTWLMETVKRVPRTAVLWEPLHQTKGVKAYRGLGFEDRPYIAEQDDRPEVREVFERMFRGKTLSNFLCHSHPTKFLEADRLIVKLCRGNALLPWLTQQFDFNRPPVHFVRHPMAVVASQMSFGAWDYDFSGYDVRAFRPGSLYERHAEFLSTVVTKHEYLAVKWCVANAATLAHERAGTDWVVLHYEHLLLDPRTHVERLFDRWGIAVPAGTLESLKKPSHTSRDRESLRDVETQVSKWQDALTQGQVDDITRVLDHFGVEAYTTDPMPCATPATRVA